MKASELYKKLDADFIKEEIRDVGWADRMPGLDRYLYPAFKQNGGMGLMCDFTGKIERVYTAVFLSERVLSRLTDGSVSNAMLFSHHPTNWDIQGHDGNYAADEIYIEELQRRHISVYILHHPLDHFGPYSTCGALAKRLRIRVERPAFCIDGAMCGVIGTTACKTAEELRSLYSQVVGHETSLYLYGDEDIRGEKVAVCPGGGNILDVAHEMVGNGIRNLITGVSIVNDYSRGVHTYERRHHINVFGGTHYSSEKFAPMAMCQYFRDCGLPAKFIDDKPNLYDL